MWEDRLDGMLDAIIRIGTLTVELPSGRIVVHGDGKPPSVIVRMSDPTLPRRLILNPELALGEGYMDETLTIDGDDLPGLMQIALMNQSRFHGTTLWWQQPLEWLRHMSRLSQHLNVGHRSKRNVAHHYDLSEKLYGLFLDEDRQYSCAYFADPGMTLEQAQIAKKAHIAGKLLIEPGMRVLDIGCGWGGMALTLARDYGAKVVGVTLSEEQHALATRRVREAGLQDQVEIRLQDYRRVPGTFDRVVSVGMFEHVGAPHFRTYFRQVRDKLAPDGVALIHTIGRMAVPSYTSPWISRYIFPGGYIPSLSEVSSAVEKEDLYMTDLEIWRLHYAETLRHWRERFESRIDEVRALYDDRFCRMWRYYLVASEQTFRYGRQCVFQVQLARHQQAVPLTRDYLYPRDRDDHRLAAE